MFINRKDPNLSHIKIGQQYVSIERMTPKKSFTEVYFGAILVLGFVALALFMIISSIGG